MYQKTISDFGCEKYQMPYCQTICELKDVSCIPLRILQFMFEICPLKYLIYLKLHEKLIALILSLEIHRVIVKNLSKRKI